METEHESPRVASLRLWQEAKSGSYASQGLTDPAAALDSARTAWAFGRSWVAGAHSASAASQTHLNLTLCHVPPIPDLVSQSARSSRRAKQVTARAGTGGPVEPVRSPTPFTLSLSWYQTPSSSLSFLSIDPAHVEISHRVTVSRRHRR
jgi:hypothetical protein